MNAIETRNTYETSLIRFIAAELAMTESFDELSSDEFLEIVLITYKHYHTSQNYMDIDGLTTLIGYMFEEGLDYRSLYEVEKLWNED